jgi:hypothetical protein
VETNLEIEEEALKTSWRPEKTLEISPLEAVVVSVGVEMEGDTGRLEVSKERVFAVWIRDLAVVFSR